MLPNEQKLFESDTGGVLLTTHRLRLHTARAGAAYYVSLMLDQISCVKVAYKSRPFLIVLAILSLIGGGWGASVSYGDAATMFGGVGLVGAIVLLVVYYRTRRCVLDFATSGGRLVFRGGGLTTEAAIEFSDAVEEARDAYLRGLRNG